MVCPFCLHNKTYIYNTRRTGKLNQTWRRHKCQNCGKAFTTRETIELENIIRVRHGKARKTEPYQKSKLLFSLLRACDHKKDIEHTVFWLTDTIEQQLLPIASQNGSIIATTDIYRTTAQVLQQFDSVCHIKYVSANEHIPDTKVSHLKPKNHRTRKAH